jgi:hypothetical protein
MQVPICTYTFAPVIRLQLWSLGFRYSSLYRPYSFACVPEGLGGTSTNQTTISTPPSRVEIVLMQSDVDSCRPPLVPYGIFRRLFVAFSSAVLLSTSNKPQQLYGARLCFSLSCAYLYTYVAWKLHDIWNERGHAIP